VIDSVNVLDSIHVVDSLNIIDSAINVIDSIHIIDSVHVIDSLYIKDSVNVIDSVVTYGPEHYFGECNALNSGVIKSATINGELRDYICDKNTLFWRLASKFDWNRKYIDDSHVEDFTPVQTVVKNLADTEKLIVILRHAERGSDYSRTGPLNENGIRQAFKLGESLQRDSINRDSVKGDIEVYYGASEFIRAHQTNNNIAKGRGELDTLADTIPALNDDWFIKNDSAYKDVRDKNGGGWKFTAMWAYEGGFADAMYDLEERSSELLEEHVIPAFENSGKQVGFFVSHDLVMMPLVVYASDRKIDLKYHLNSTNHWLNYLGGIAIVFKPDGTRVFYAVKGLDSGTM
jgi:broad specificity phosphatase PhoE